MTDPLGIFKTLLRALFQFGCSDLDFGISRIQNPAAHLQVDEDIFTTGFIVPEDRWRRGERLS